ncbi:MAG: Stp1/IreP family PP2C-type Ser/Thr phosphatase [Candidatus Aminicenantes bacterium]|nr:Stp1/IreP family PP2C-type Ser/Thr phosphatase [Candidatus Aminicenantes bacterium]
MEIISYGKSDIGKVRDNNEDFLTTKKISENEHLFIVADGMGGHQAGNVASKLGVETFVKHYRVIRKKGTSIPESLLESINKSNSAVLTKASTDLDKRGMGTTFSALLISDSKVNIVHIGDSRVYLVRDDKIKRITTDHTFVEKMVAEGRITPEEARRHPQKNILYMSLGARETFHPDEITGLEVKNNDIFLICSDGLTDMVTDDVIKEYCQSYSPEKAVDELITLSNRNGGLDNISIIVIEIGGEKKHRTEPIKIPGKKKGRSLFLMLSLLFMTLLIFGSLLLKKEKLPAFSNDLREISFKPLEFEEKEKLDLVRQSPGSVDSDSIRKFISENTLMVKTSNSISLIFSKKEFIAVQNGDVLFRNTYRFGKSQISLESIYFDKASNGLVAIDDEKKIYKMLVK